MSGRRILGFALLFVSQLNFRECAGAATTSAAKTNRGETVRAEHTERQFLLGNNVVAARWSVEGPHIRNLTLIDLLHKSRITVIEPFSILMKNGKVYHAEDLITAGGIEEVPVIPHPGDSTFAKTVEGKEFRVDLESDDHILQAMWSVIVLEGSSYLRQTVTVKALSTDLPIERVQLIDVLLPESRVDGTVKGSPIVTDRMFFGFEHPISQSRVTSGRATAWIDRDLPLKAGQSITYSSVFGVVHKGQLRRDFLQYVERERAHPYRTFLHYNSWYDLGYFTPYSQSDALDRIHTFGDELSKRRGVKLDSFLFDDGWDDHKSLWHFNTGFPQGFTPIREGAESVGAAPGVWMSPWGGYSTPKKERIEFGTKAGYEIVKNGYALSGPKYYDAFRNVCIEMIRKYGVNQFKIDGTGNVNSVFPGSSFDSDFSAAIQLIEELRAERPSLFINLTTGTWPSPFWLKYSDTIWRGGEDDDFAGVGNYRERWITYRDADTYERVVQAGPLFPLNSLMLHGIIYAKFHKHLNVDRGDDFRNEVRSYFGTGTQLQEMYITPSLLSQANWDDLAEAAKWSRENASVLRDTHWIGGNPAWLEVYGWASWTPQKAILVLRNPSDRPKQIALTLQNTFEMPIGSKQSFSARSPWTEDAKKAGFIVNANRPHTFSLKPFEVLTLDFLPR